jgi:K+/H+ antiporter YhaU regulatory subunit KhtT
MKIDGTVYHIETLRENGKFLILSAYDGFETVYFIAETGNHSIQGVKFHLEKPKEIVSILAKFETFSEAEEALKRHVAWLLTGSVRSDSPDVYGHFRYDVPDGNQRNFKLS